MPTELKIPEVGESVTEVHIGTWHKDEGDAIEVDDVLVEIETDKASMELPAPVRGVLEKILMSTGDTAQVGDAIATIAGTSDAPDDTAEAGHATAPSHEGASPEHETDVQPGQDEAQPATEHDHAELDAGSSETGEEQPETKEDRPDKEEDQAEENEGQPETEEDRHEKEQEQAEVDEGRPVEQQDQPEKDGAPHAKEADTHDSAPPHIEVQPRVMPDAHELLTAHGLTADDVHGSGPGGRVLREDVLQHVSDPPAREGPRPTEPSPDVDSVPMSRLRRTIAQRLVSAQRDGALVTTFNEVDVSEVLALRRRLQEGFRETYQVKVGVMSFFVRAVVEALRRIPELNAEIRDMNIVYHRRCDIGVAVSTDDGLVVPVLRGADRMSLAEVEQGIAELANKARDRSLTPDDLTNGTFTISNGGVFGSLLSTPIINPPQSGILGLHAIQDRPVAREGKVVIRPMMYVALTYDHRIIDGREAVMFLNHVKDLVETPARMLLGI